MWSFPNYVIGAGLTAIASVFSTVSGLATLGTLVAVLFAIYQSYKTYVGRSEQIQPKAMAMAAGR
jgi:energy-converting hydrogenase Eha subunit A